MLFADADDQGIAFGASLTSCVIAIGTALFAYLQSRNKNTHEVEMKRLDADIQGTKEDLQIERGLRAKLQADHSKCESDHNETKIKLANLQGRMSAVEKKVE